MFPLSNRFRDFTTTLKNTHHLFITGQFHPHTASPHIQPLLQALDRAYSNYIVGDKTLRRIFIQRMTHWKSFYRPPHQRLISSHISIDIVCEILRPLSNFTESQIQYSNNATRYNAHKHILVTLMRDVTSAYANVVAPTPGIVTPSRASRRFGNHGNWG